MSMTLIRVDLAVRSAAARTITALRQDRGEVNIVATVLLIVIAVALIVLFQKNITKWITSMISKIDSGISSVTG
jgi:flagellin-like protein